MIIRSLLDTDLYKFTMMQVVQHHFAEAQVEYRFKCRNSDIDLSPYVREIEEEIGEEHEQGGYRREFGTRVVPGEMFAEDAPQLHPGDDSLEQW